MKLFYTTEEVAGHFDIPISKLGFYIKEFRINVKKVSGVRKFSHKDFEKIGDILKLLNEEGFTIEGAKAKLKSKTTTARSNQEIIEKLKDIRKALVIIQENIE